jgi:surface polysaccharide O-acyltransferase-like enzyme
MTSISPAVASTQVQAAPTAKARNLSIDRARTFLTLVIVLHHSVLAYTYFGHTDAKYWIGFDCVVLVVDSSLMAVFFFISGLFVWPSLVHKAPGVFLRDRLLRLGLPFVIAAFTITPIAYYAPSLRNHPDIGFAAFWWKTITIGPWPSGPVWFVWVLLALNLAAAVLYRISPSLLDPINRLSLSAFDRPANFYLFLLAISAIIYIPGLVYFGPGRWFTLGPLDVQADRILLYAAYFFIGVGVGAAHSDRGLLSADGQLAKSGWGWVIAALVPYGVMWGLIAVKYEIMGNPDPLPNWYEVSYGPFFVAFSAGILFAILGYFLRFKRSGWSVLDPLQADAYGIFVVHYPFVLWLQYWLFDFNLPAIFKAAVTFVLAVALSTAATMALRKIPGATHVL